MLLNLAVHFSICMRLPLVLGIYSTHQMPGKLQGRQLQ